MPKITVIVPIYNVAPFIERCARSLFEQTLDEMELLFVDDCSPDNSISIIERLIDEYRFRFENNGSIARIIGMPNNIGLAGVRRIGIIDAIGDYVIHCDGDDWVDTDLYERMYREAVTSGADVVMCGSIFEYERHSEIHEVNNAPGFCKDVVRYWYRKCVGMHCWNKLVRRRLYTDNEILPWVGLNMWEDNGLMSRVFYYGDKMSVVHGTYYHYNRMNVKAMTQCYGQTQVGQMVEVAEHLTEFFEKRPDSDDFRKTVMAFQFLAKLNLITDSFTGIKDYHTIFPKSENIASELDRGAFSTRGRFRFFMVSHKLAWLFVLMFKVRGLFMISK